MNKITKIIEKIEIVLSSSFLGVIFFVTLSNIILRYFFNKPLFWAEEVIAFFFTWLGFITITYAVSTDEHVRFTSIVCKFPQKLNKVLRIILHILLIIIIAIFYPSMLKSMGFLIKSPALQFPMIYIYIVVPLTYALMVFHLIINIITLLKSKNNVTEVK